MVRSDAADELKELVDRSSKPLPCLQQTEPVVQLREPGDSSGDGDRAASSSGVAKILGDQRAAVVEPDACSDPSRSRNPWSLHDFATQLSRAANVEDCDGREMLDGPVRSDVENRLMIHGPWPARVDEEICLLLRAKLNAGGLDRFS